MQTATTPRFGPVPPSDRPTQRTLAPDALARDTLALAVRMLRAAEDELDDVLAAISLGTPPSAERFERVESSYLEARALAARAYDLGRRERNGVKIADRVGRTSEEVSASDR